MKRVALFAILLFCACNRGALQALPPEVYTLSVDTSLHNVNGSWMHKGKPYSGYIVEKDSDRTVAKLPVVNGKENGEATGWYKNGKKRYERNFRNGNREGVHKGWYEDGALAFIFFFKDDKYEGEQKTYFKNGAQWQSLNYKHGYEEGKQKSWNDSGRVVNNFTVRNGKLYGVIGRYDCMSVYKK